MALGGGQEKEVKELIEDHLKKVGETLASMVKALGTYLAGNIEEAKKLALQTHTIESEADSRRRSIIERLYQGAFLPAYREGLANFVARQDKIADRAESCTDLLLCQRPEIPAEYREEFLKIASDSCSCFSPMKEAVANLFADFAVLRAKVKEINQLEEKVDRDEWDLTHKIYLSNLPLAQKIQLGDFVWHIAAISDVTEDAADCLEILVVKKQF